MGEVTIVFNNAGVRLVRPFVQYTQEQIEKMISVNLMGQVRVRVCTSVYKGGKKVGQSDSEGLRHSQAEHLSKSRNKLHPTAYQPFFPPLNDGQDYRASRFSRPDVGAARLPAPADQERPR